MPPSGTPATFSYQTVTSSNVLTGTPNTPVNIAPGATQNFVFGVTPTTSTTRNLAMRYDCTNSSPAPTTYGLTTFGYSSGSGYPDMVAVASTIGNTGYAKIPSNTGSTAFAVAVVNIGTTRTVTARVTQQAVGGTNPNYNANLNLCRSNSAGTCISGIGPSVNFTASASGVYTFSVFVTGTGFVANNPATNRAHVYFDYGATPTGATGVAVCTGC